MAKWTELDPASEEVRRCNADILDWLANLGVKPRVFRDERGVLRFRKNPIVDRLLRLQSDSEAGFDLNAIAREFGDRPADRAEFYTLFGYSLSGFSEIFTEEIYEFREE